MLRTNSAGKGEKFKSGMFPGPPFLPLRASLEAMMLAASSPQLALEVALTGTALRGSGDLLQILLSASIPGLKNVSFCPECND